MELFCAIDLRQGAAVRLVQGDFDRQRHYGDPLELASRYVRGGARWIHVVDLDAARNGRPVNRAVVEEIARAVEVPVQVGGGVRTEEDVAALVDAGVARVVIGTAALDTALVARLADHFPKQVAVGIDHRGRQAEVAVSGWEEATGVTVTELLARLEEVPLAAVIVTAIERDGMLRGPDLEGLGRVLACTSHEVVASGGVRSVDDLGALARLRAGDRELAGTIVGRALVDGLLSVEEAVQACAPSG